jgi:hypothetical protein
MVVQACYWERAREEERETEGKRGEAAREKERGRHRPGRLQEVLLGVLGSRRWKQEVATTGT